MTAVDMSDRPMLDGIKPLAPQQGIFTIYLHHIFTLLCLLLCGGYRKGRPKRGIGQGTVLIFLYGKEMMTVCQTHTI